MDSTSIGARVRAQRKLRGWSQQRLAAVAGCHPRTVQRIELGRTRPAPDTLQDLAAAFNVDISELLVGLTEARLEDLQDAFLCPRCRSPLIARHFIADEYGDAEVEVFECGMMRGAEVRPCPEDPRFPQFEDYSLHFEESGDGRWFCHARGKTDAARQVHLGQNFGFSRDGAALMARRSYTSARYGCEEGERQYPLDSLLAIAEAPAA